MNEQPAHNIIACCQLSWLKLTIVFIDNMEKTLCEDELLHSISTSFNFLPQVYSNYVIIL